MHEPTITLTGNVAAKPEFRLVDTAHGATAVATLRVASTPRRKARDGDDWIDGETMWFRVSAWRGAATNAVASLNQGDRVVITGRLTQRTWTDSGGIERSDMQVDAECVGLDISRHAAKSARGTSEPRSEAAQQPTDSEQPADSSPEDVWVSTGQVDLETGEVRLEPANG